MILVIDQGTTSTRAIVFGADAAPVASAQAEFPADLSASGLGRARPRSAVANDARDRARGASARRMRRQRPRGDRDRQPARNHADLGALDRPADRQCDRLAGPPHGGGCARRLKAEGLEPQVTAATGLVHRSLFRRDQDRLAARQRPGRARGGRARRTGVRHRRHLPAVAPTNGAVHATDATNASRTMLYDIRKGGWDDDDAAALPRAALRFCPRSWTRRPSIGASAPEHLGAAVPIRALIGDQQSALIGQACVEPGMVKATYGTGGFLLLNTGETPAPSLNRLLTTVAYQWRGKRAYALEGSIFSAGATVQWLRDGLGSLRRRLKRASSRRTFLPTEGVYLVPAFAGLGAPLLELGGARASAASRAGRRARRSRGRRWRASAIRRATSIEAMTADAGRRDRASFASTAAWRRATGRCSSRRHAGRRRSTGRPISSRPRWARPSPPAGRPASIPARSCSPSGAAATASSRPPWTRRRASALYRGWREAVRRAL